MAEIAYLLCALTSLTCAVLLIRGFTRSRSRFLLWSAACFGCLAANNAMLFVDRVVFPDDVLIFVGVSITVWRGVVALVGISLLLFGLVWDAD